MSTANLFLYRDMSVYLLEHHAKRRACSQTLLSGECDCLKLTNATQCRFAVHISHYLKLWFKNNLVL